MLYRRCRWAWSALAAATLIAGCSRPEDVTRGDWPQWRGPGGQGISPLAGLPEVWSAETPNIRWRVEVPGAGNSSPIVSGGRVFLTSAWGKPGDSPRKAERRRNIQFALAALDLATGEILWQTSVFSSRKAKKHWFNTHATPTPVTDGERVYVYFGTVLAAVDFEGRVVWSEEIDTNYSRYSRYGAAASPILTSEAVIVTQDREYGETDDVGWIAAYDKATGRQLWRDEWQHTCCSYTTPILYGAGSGVQVLNSTSGEVVGYDARTGERLWAGQYGSTQPVPSMVTAGQILSVPGGVHNRSIFVLRLNGGGKDPAPELLWKSKRGVPEISSPVLYQGKLFAVTEGGIMVCYDAETGELLWRGRLAGGKYHSSLVAGDGKVYALNDLGVTSVVAAKSEFELIAENDLADGGGRSSPAISQECLLIRTRARLYCIEKEAA